MDEINHCFPNLSLWVPSNCLEEETRRSLIHTTRTTLCCYHSMVITTHQTVSIKPRFWKRKKKNYFVSLYVSFRDVLTGKWWDCCFFWCPSCVFPGTLETPKMTDLGKNTMKKHCTAQDHFPLVLEKRAVFSYNSSTWNTHRKMQLCTFWNAQCAKKRILSWKMVTSRTKVWIAKFVMYKPNVLVA